MTVAIPKTWVGSRRRWAVRVRQLRTLLPRCPQGHPLRRQHT